ncbi:hypothetical protein [Aurantimonas marina]|uniref:hypothetical protein n=1 Tax=Aurantimonas marina TaxID=2780508 RepID=UPI0019D0F3A5|nr:hypothetical protein [Aurantimonas marina]
MQQDLTFQSVRVGIGREAADGRLVFFKGMLLAVLVRLCGAHYGAMESRWFLEAGFGPCAEIHPLPFETLEDAGLWIGEVGGSG